MIRAFAVSLVCGAALSACAVLPDREGPGEVTRPELDPERVVENPEDAPECPAEEYQVLVGQPREEIHYESLPEPHRVYGEGDMVTMDYRRDRMNIVVGMDGRVVEVKCG